jgi:hypothetical protein
MESARPIQHHYSRLSWWLDVALVLTVFYLYAGWPTPDVNEAHYLAKARHYWDPTWCPNDIFLNSANAHFTFYWIFGWLTVFLPLPVVAWIGRLITWALLSIAWVRIHKTLFDRRWLPVLSSVVFIALWQTTQIAGEWLLGGVEGKGFAYVCVFFAIDDMLNRRWNRVWIWLGVASAFHVLVGGWSVLCGLVAWYSTGKQRPTFQSMFPSLLLGLTLSLPGLIPGLMLTSNADPVVVQEANIIYVFRRVPHHTVFHHFLYVSSNIVALGKHVALIAIWIAVACYTPCRACRAEGEPATASQRALRGFTIGALMLSCFGVLFDQLLLHNPILSAALLKYYWFRLGDLMVPFAAAVALCGLYVQLLENKRHWARALVLALILFSAIPIFQTFLQRRKSGLSAADQQSMYSQLKPDVDLETKQRDWIATCKWIKENTPTDALFLTPKLQQTFKWNAERSEVCNWKDTPQDAKSVVAWWERLGKVYPGEVNYNGLYHHQTAGIQALASEIGFQYVVVDSTFNGPPFDFPKIYPNPDHQNGSYEIYRVPSPPLPAKLKQLGSPHND